MRAGNVSKVCSHEHKGRDVGKGKGVRWCQLGVSSRGRAKGAWLSASADLGEKHRA